MSDAATMPATAIEPIGPRMAERLRRVDVRVAAGPYRVPTRQIHHTPTHAEGPRCAIT